jgi:hypothetical protein
MMRSVRPAILSRMDADSFMFFALEAAALLGMALFIVTVFLLGSRGPEMDG